MVLWQPIAKLSDRSGRLLERREIRLLLRKAEHRSFGSVRDVIGDEGFVRDGLLGFGQKVALELDESEFHLVNFVHRQSAAEFTLVRIARGSTNLLIDFCEDVFVFLLCGTYLVSNVLSLFGDEPVREPQPVGSDQSDQG